MKSKHFWQMRPKIRQIVNTICHMVNEAMATFTTITITHEIYLTP